MPVLLLADISKAISIGIVGTVHTESFYNKLVTAQVRKLYFVRNY